MRLAAAVYALLLLAAAGTAQAEETAKIGAILPLGGATFALGAAAKAAITLGTEIVNAPHDGLESLPLGAGQGLPHLQGAKIEVIFADDLGNPSVAQSQAWRLATRDKVAALIGGDGAAAIFAERQGLPFVVAGPALAGPPAPLRAADGWVFRTQPNAADLARVYAQFLAELKAGGSKIDRFALVHPSGDRGDTEARPLRETLAAAGIGVAAEIPYPAGATDLSVPLQHLRETNPDVAILAASATDAALMIKTMKALDYRPPLLLAGGAGFSDPAFVAAAGNLAQGLVDRSTWSGGPPGSASAIIAGLYRTRSGRDLDDAGARVLQAFLVLAEAIDRAGSTDPAAVRQALQATDLKPEELVVGYRGVRFDERGQNMLAGAYLRQLQGKGYVTVWPAAAAAARPLLPYRGWK